MNYDIPKTPVYVSQKPAIEIRSDCVNPLNSPFKSNSDSTPKPEAPDFGGYLVSNTTGGTAVSASNVSPQLVAPHVNSVWGQSLYIIPFYGAILEVEVERQIAASNLQDRAEISERK